MIYLNTHVLTVFEHWISYGTT